MAYTQEQIQRFKTVMGNIDRTTSAESFKDTAFLIFLIMHGVYDTEVGQKALKEVREFSKYLNSIGVGVVSDKGGDEKVFGFMFLDDAKEIGATITKE